MFELSWCWNPVRQLAAIAYPWREDAKDASLLFRWCLHLMLWTCLLAGLWYINRVVNIERMLRSPWPALHGAWLPLLGLLVYGLGWLSRGLWISLRPEPMASQWSDLESAWIEARFNLAQGNIDLRKTPLFLVLGPLTRDLQGFLESLGARAMSQRSSLPFQTFAQREAIFVACGKLSQLGHCGEALPTAEWSETTSARLFDLCKRLMSEPTGAAPIQGIVLSAEFKRTPSKAATRVAIEAMQSDLRVVRQATGLQVPLYLAVSGFDCGAEDALAQSFPPLPDLDPAEIHSMFQEGIDALFLDRVARAVRAKLTIDDAPMPPGQLGPALQKNVRLYQSLHTLQDWRTHLGKLIVEGTQNEYSEPGMVAGCYLLPGGAAIARLLGADLLAHRHTATWSTEAIAIQTQRRQRTWLGYGLGFAVACCGFAWLGWSFLRT